MHKNLDITKRILKEKIKIIEKRELQNKKKNRAFGNYEFNNSYLSSNADDSSMSLKSLYSTNSNDTLINDNNDNDINLKDEINNTILEDISETSDSDIFSDSNESNVSFVSNKSNITNNKNMESNSNINVNEYNEFNSYLNKSNDVLDEESFKVLDDSESIDTSDTYINEDYDKLILFSDIFNFMVLQPEYIIKIEKNAIFNEETNEKLDRFSVRVQKLIDRDYTEIENQFISPFMDDTELSCLSNLREIMEDITAEITIPNDQKKSTLNTNEITSSNISSETENEEHIKKIKTKISRGFCLTIPGFGYLIISHNGDVVVNNEIIINSMRIISPSHVIIKNIKSEIIEIEASSLSFLDNHSFEINTLEFKGNQNDPLLSHILCGLFIKEKTNIVINNLFIKKGLLLNYGHLTIKENNNLDEGYIFNIGTINFKENTHIIKDIHYMYNGVNGKIISDNNVIFGIHKFINYGNIKIKEIGFSSTGSFLNKGTIETTKCFELRLLGKGINSGLLNGSSGKIIIKGEDFNHLEGKIIVSKIHFQTLRTQLNSTVRGQEIHLQGEVITSGEIHFQYGIIEGYFVNTSEKIKFEKKLELRGKHSEIHNHNKIFADLIVSTAETGIINRGLLTAKNLIVEPKKHIQLQCLMPLLKKINVNASSKLLIAFGSYTPKLKSIINFGDITIYSNLSKLSHIENSDTGNIYLENEKAFNSIYQLSDIHGHIAIKGSLPKLKYLYLNNGALLTLLENSNLPLVKKVNLEGKSCLLIKSNVNLPCLNYLKVNEGSECVLEKDVIAEKIKNIYNNGYISCSIPLLNLRALINRKDSNFFFLNKAFIKGRIFNNDDLESITINPNLKNYLNHEIAIFNEGNIYVDITSSHINISGDYIGAENSVFRLENGFISFMNKFINKGIVYSPELLHYNIGLTTTIRKENGQSISEFFNKQKSIHYSSFNSSPEFKDNTINLGQNVAENGIIFTLECKNSKIDKSFEPIINGKNKELIIISKYDLNFNSNIEWNTDLYMKIPDYESKYELKLRSLFLDTGSFSNSNNISTQNGTSIISESFKNEHGRIESFGDVSICANRKFQNTGGGSIQKNIPEHIHYYTCTTEKKKLCYGNGGRGFFKRLFHSTSSEKYYYKVSTKIESHNKVIYRDIYDIQLEKAGVITSGKNLTINCNNFDNSFGILNASKKLNIHSFNELKNECGLMYSGNEAYLQGKSLNNGYKKYSEKFEGIDINEPIRESLPVLYQQWVQSGHWKGTGGFFGKVFGGKKWVDTSHYENRTRNENLVVGYKPLDTYSTSSEYPGYIFSKGDININVDSDPSYIGTIVSGENINFKGNLQKIANYKDRGLMIAKGDVNMEMNNALHQQFAIQANNIFINLTEDLVIQGIVKPMVIQNEKGESEAVQMVNLKKFANWMGFLSDKHNFLKYDQEINTLTNYVSISREDWEEEYLTYKTSDAGFIGGAPNIKYFMPTIQEKMLTQLLQFILTPIYGREILLNENLKDELTQRGAMIVDALLSNKLLPHSNKKITKHLKNKQVLENKPVLLYGKSHQSSTNIEKNNMKKNIPLYDPYLITNTISQIVNKIIAQKKMKIKTKGNLDFRPCNLNFEAKELSVESEKKIRFLGEYKYGHNNYTRTGVEKVSLNFNGDFEVSGKEGILFKGTEISANNFIRKSKEGNIQEKAMPLDQNVKYINSNTVSVTQDSVTSSFTAKNSIKTTALKGNIIQEGTDMEANNIIFEAKNHIWSPVYQDQLHYAYEKKGYAKTEIKVPKDGGIYSKGTITFKSKDTSLSGIQIFSKKVSNPADGKFSIHPSYIYQNSESHYKTNSLFGSSSRDVIEKKELVKPSVVMVDYFESKGQGLCEFESVVLKALDALIEKDFVEKTAYDKIDTYIHESSSGFFAPKIKHDPIFDTLQNIKSVVNLGSSATLGDIVPSTFTTVGSIAKAINDIKVMSNLDMFKDPFTQMAKVIMSRYVSNIGFGSHEMTMKRSEKKPHQSKIEVEVLKINNKKTQMEGNYNIKRKGVIETEDFKVNSPRHVIKQQFESNGWSISLSTVAIALASCGIGSAVAACLPSINTYESSGNYYSSKPIPMTMKADELYIRCNNAVFKGSKIRSRLLDMIVTENLTIESLLHEIKSESHSSSFGIDIGAIYSVLNPPKPSNGIQSQGAPNDNIFQKLNVIPSFRSVDEKAISKKLDDLAELIGEEKFYLTVGKVLKNKGSLVGLLPDGLAVKKTNDHNENEHIEAGEIINESVNEYEDHERHVVNPSLSEFFSMMSQIDEYKKLQRDIDIHNMIKDINKGSKEEFFKRKDIKKLINERNKYITIMKTLREKDKQIRDEFKKDGKNEKSLYKNFEQEKRIIRKNAIDVRDQLEKEINKLLSENDFNDETKQFLMSILIPLNSEIMYSSLDSIVKNISIYDNKNKKENQKSTINENNEKKLNNGKSGVKGKKPMVNDDNNNNDFNKNKNLTNYAEINNINITNDYNDKSKLNTENNINTNSDNSKNETSSTSLNNTDTNRIPTFSENYENIKKNFDIIIDNPKLAASIAYNELKELIIETVNNENIHAFFKHIDMVPGAVKEIIKDEIISTCKCIKICITNYDKIPNAIKDIYYDYMKDGPIEGSLCIFIDLVSYGKERGIISKNSISNVIKSKPKKVIKSQNNMSLKSVNDNNLLNKEFNMATNDNNSSKYYKAFNDNGSKGNLIFLDNSIKNSSIKSQNNMSLKSVNDNNLLNKEFNMATNDNNSSKYYKAFNDNGSKGNLIFLDNSIKNSSIKSQNNISLNEYLPSEPSSLSDLVFHPKYLKDIINKPETFFKIKSKAECTTYILHAIYSSDENKKNNKNDKYE
ncbi:hypothetical protein BCR36DRAFT_415521 [Piromyces finnis]|uniref:Uncharacterized protein n=1 Tax=Piromyces finnis TaxID=1754191 RepID=A0A1Y1UZV5_9FUNG|nr:hypothetical protein BCR36DRAFT_415521 [Piromyces finnis]|eukprot:ORX43506.1 hypothetical protein BCR36DRAFT_415521 [Piromyces finnis]